MMGMRMNIWNRRSKYHAVRTKVDGFSFASKREACRYSELKLLGRAGEISDIKLQPRFTLQEGFRDREGKKHRPIVYVADFRYKEKDGNRVRVVIEDVKGMKTPVYEIKKKL